MNFHIITLFPNLVRSYLSESILARAIKTGKISATFYNPRDYAKPTSAQKNKEKPYLRVDHKPYGGGPGMVMQALPVIKAVEAAVREASKVHRFGASKKGSKVHRFIGSNSKIGKTGRSEAPKLKIVFFSPGGKKFDTAYAKSAAKKYSDVILICGRYEGIDARVRKIFKADEVSVGDYVLTGGEVPAMILIDSIARQVEGVLGNFSSREEERVSSKEVYTRPEVLRYKGKEYKVPKVLLSGHHARIEKWKSKAKAAPVPLAPKQAPKQGLKTVVDNKKG